MATTSSEKTLKDLFVHALKDIYYAENAILKALPKVISHVKHAELKKGLTEHLHETEGHVKRLADVFGELGAKPASVRCEAIEGLWLGLAHLLDKPGEEVMAVPRPRRGLGMILHRESRPIRQRNAAVGLIEQRDMGDAGVLRQSVGIEREAVVHRDDFNLVGREILHRVIGAVMALRHFHRLGADGET